MGKLADEAIGSVKVQPLVALLTLVCPHQKRSPGGQLERRPVLISYSYSNGRR